MAGNLQETRLGDSLLRWQHLRQPGQLRPAEDERVVGLRVGAPLGLFANGEELVGEIARPHQQKQAKTQLENADKTVTSRLPECYQWLIVPTQSKPQDPVEWSAFRLIGTEPLAARASRKMKTDELLVVGLAATRLRLELDNVPLWRGDHVAIKMLVEDFARYTYLPRLRDSGVLIDAIAEGLSLLTWHHESFAYADGWDEAEERYRGLRCGQHVAVTEDSTGILVKPEPALRQYEAERPSPTGQTPGPVTPGGPTPGPTDGGPTAGGTAPEPPKLKRFHGSIQLDAQRVARDAGTIAQEVISHLAGMVGADVKVTLEIDAFIPIGASEQVVRTVTENARTLHSFVIMSENRKLISVQKWLCEVEVEGFCRCLKRRIYR